VLQQLAFLVTIQHALQMATVVMDRHVARLMTPGSNAAGKATASLMLVAAAGRVSFVTPVLQQLAFLVTIQHALQMATVVMDRHVARLMTPGSNAAGKATASLM